MSVSKKKALWPYRLSIGLLLSIPLFSPSRLFGAELATEQTQPATQQTQPTEQIQPVQQQQPELLDTVDAPRNYLSAQIISLATSIDRFFGDQRNYQESNQSVVQMELSKVSGYGGDPRLEFSARANLNLPSTEKRLHIMIESNPDQNVTGETVRQQTTPTTDQLATPQSYGLAVRYQKLKEELEALHLSTDAGIQFHGISLNPFVRARGSYSVPMDQWRLKLAETIFWFNSIGIGETTQLDLEHSLSEQILFRATTIAAWLNDKQNFDLSQSLSIYHNLSERSALLYQAGISGVSNPQYEVTEYVASIVYRYRLHRNWMFFELSPQLHFPKTDNFKSNPALSTRLEILFDESK